MCGDRCGRICRFEETLLGRGGMLYGFGVLFGGGRNVGMRGRDRVGQVKPLRNDRGGRSEEDRPPRSCADMDDQAEKITCMAMLNACSQVSPSPSAKSIEAKPTRFTVRLSDE